MRDDIIKYNNLSYDIHTTHELYKELLDMYLKLKELQNDELTEHVWALIFAIKGHKIRLLKEQQSLLISAFPPRPHQLLETQRRRNND